MRIDIHNHTTRCNHAEGTVDEYIQKLDAQYAPLFTQLENQWLILERLNPKLQKPEFFKPENRHLPNAPENNRYKSV